MLAGPGRRAIVFTPPPTPNGGLHVGHVGGPYLRADLFVRLRRFFKDEPWVDHACHVDTYQSYVVKKARETARTPESVVSEYTGRLRADFCSYAVDHTFWGDNTRGDYRAFLEVAFAEAERRLPLNSREVDSCTRCRHVLTESFAKGTCRQCLHDAYANVCENCQSPQFGTLQAVLCTACGLPGEGSEPVRTLRISAKAVADVEAVMRGRYKDTPGVGSFLRSLAPHDVMWMYPTSYGVFPGQSGLALNPWVEIFFYQLFTVMKSAGIDTSAPFCEQILQLKKKEFDIAYFFGVDNTYYYAFLFTYLASILGIETMIPVQLKVNQFMRINGDKVSTSRGNLISAQELSSEAPVGVLRTRLARSCPEYGPMEYQVIDRLAAPLLRDDEDPYRRPADTAHRPTESDAWDPLEAIDGRLRSLASIDRFSVGDLLNTIDKGRAYALALRAAEPEDRQADLLEGYLSRLCSQLLLA